VVLTTPDTSTCVSVVAVTVLHVTNFATVVQPCNVTVCVPAGTPAPVNVNTSTRPASVVSVAVAISVIAVPPNRTPVTYAAVPVPCTMTTAPFVSSDPA